MILNLFSRIQVDIFQMSYINNIYQFIIIIHKYVRIYAINPNYTSILYRLQQNYT